jgi:hypothetical protein
LTSRPQPPPSDEAAEGLLVTITLAPDGRVYFHELPTDMVDVAESLNPDDRELALRRQAARVLKR